MSTGGETPPKRRHPNIQREGALSPEGEQTMLESMYMKLQLAFAGLRPTAQRQEGQAMVEYALILSLVSIAAVAVLKTTGTSIHDILQSVANDL